MFWRRTLPHSAAFFVIPCDLSFSNPVAFLLCRSVFQVPLTARSLAPILYWTHDLCIRLNLPRFSLPVSYVLFSQCFLSTSISHESQFACKAFIDPVTSVRSLAYIWIRVHDADTVCRTTSCRLHLFHNTIAGKKNRSCSTAWIFFSGKFAARHDGQPRVIQGSWDMGVAWCSRLQLKCDGTRWHTSGAVKGKLANGVGSQYPSHYLGTWCIQDYYRLCAHLGWQ